MKTNNIDNKSNKQRDEYLKVALGDIVMQKETKRLGCIHRLGPFSKNNFVVKWLNNNQMNAYTSRKSQQELVNTGKNIHDSDDESD